METEVVQKNEMKMVLESLGVITKLLQQDEKNNTKKEMLNNEEMIKFLGVSRRTLQKYRDEGMLAFVQIKDKIYYKHEDIEEFLNRNHNKAFKK